MTVRERIENTKKLSAGEIMTISNEALATSGADDA
jgi:hypothetical protein